MSIYELIIGEATGVTDLAMVRRIEEAIRIEHSSLSNIERRQLESEARIAHAAIKLIDARATP